MGLAAALILGFFVFEALGYGFHRLLHTRWAGPLNRAHMQHHLRHYPPGDLVSARYRSAGGSSTLYPFLVAGAALAAAVVWLVPLCYALPLLAELALVGALNDVLHTAVHVQHDRLARWALFRRWRDLHQTHHVEMDRNYGVVTFLADHLAGTFRG